MKIHNIVSVAMTLAEPEVMAFVQDRARAAMSDPQCLSKMLRSHGPNDELEMNAPERQRLLGDDNERAQTA